MLSQWIICFPPNIHWFCFTPLFMNNELCPVFIGLVSLWQGRMLRRLPATVLIVTNAIVFDKPLEALAETCQADNSVFNMNMPLLLFVALIGATVGGKVLSNSCNYSEIKALIHAFGCEHKDIQFVHAINYMSRLYRDSALNLKDVRT